MKPIKIHWLVSGMLIIGGIVNLTIWNPFEDYLVRFIEGQRKMDFNYDSMSIGRKRKAICSKNSIMFSLLKTGEKLLVSMRHASQHTS